MMMGEERYVDVAGVRTRCFVAGSGGPTLVLLHATDFGEDGVCHNALAWEFVLPALAPGMRVIAFDAPGHGRSGPPAGDEGYGLPGLVAHARGVIEALAVGPVHLVGHDEGGMVALRLAFEAPQLLASCGIVAGAAAAPAGDPLSNLTLSAPLEPRFSRPGQAWVLERLSFTPHHVTAGGFLDEAVAAARGEGFRAARARLAEGGVHGKVARPSLARARVANWKALREQGLPVPTVLIWGANDPLSPMQNALSLFGLIAPGQRIAQLRFIGRAGTMPFREQPAAFNEILGGFIRALEQTRERRVA